MTPRGAAEDLDRGSVCGQQCGQTARKADITTNIFKRRGTADLCHMKSNLINDWLFAPLSSNMIGCLETRVFAMCFQVGLHLIQTRETIERVIPLGIKKE